MWEHKYPRPLPASPLVTCQSECEGGLMRFLTVDGHETGKIQMSQVEKEESDIKPRRSRRICLLWKRFESWHQCRRAVNKSNASNSRTYTLHTLLHTLQLLWARIEVLEFRVLNGNILSPGSVVSVWFHTAGLQCETTSHHAFHCKCKCEYTVNGVGLHSDFAGLC